MRKKTGEAEVRDSIERIIGKNTDFTTVETYKTIRTNVMFSLPKSDRGKVISITSSSPDEGKSTTSINLAITFAQMGAKVILLDCDLRKSRLHRYLEIQRNEGVSNVLCGFAELDKIIIKNVRENLDVLTAGEIPPNPAELLETNEFDILLENLRDKYDYIFVDTPPVTIVTDGVIVAKKCDGVIIVVKENQTTYDMLDEAINLIKLAGTTIIGVIMLGVEFKHKRYGYYKTSKYISKYKYGYTYGDDAVSKQKNNK